MFKNLCNRCEGSCESNISDREFSLENGWFRNQVAESYKRGFILGEYCSEMWLDKRMKLEIGLNIEDF